MYSKKAILTGTMALALLTGGGLYSASSVNAAAAEQVQTGKAQPGERGVFVGYGQLQAKLGELLSLDADTLKDKLKNNTLSEVATAQGVSNDTLKTNLIEWMVAKQPSNTTKTGNIDYSTAADKILAAKGDVFLGGGHKGFARSGRFAENEKLADLLGLPTDELKTQLEAGSSLAAIANTQGVDIDDVLALLVADEQTKLAEQKSSGKLTDTQYNEHLALLLWDI